MKLFNQVMFNKPKLNKFDLSHEKKLTMRMGNLVPIFLQEILPGDKFRVNTEILMRLQPMLSPIYGRLRIQVDYFFVPNRLVWDSWEEFITGGEDGTSAPLFPLIRIGEAEKAEIAIKTLADYMGIPTSTTTGHTNTIQFSALPFRGYQTIFNEYYRDQNLIIS